MTTESTPAAATIIHDDKPLRFERAITDSNALWLDASELKQLAGLGAQAGGNLPRRFVRADSAWTRERIQLEA